MWTSTLGGGILRSLGVADLGIELSSIVCVSKQRVQEEQGARNPYAELILGRLPWNSRQWDIWLSTFEADVQQTGDAGLER